MSRQVASGLNALQAALETLPPKPKVQAVEPLLAQAAVLLAAVQRQYLEQGREHRVVSATLIHAHRALGMAEQALRIVQDGEWATTELCDVALALQRAWELSSH
jgi:protein-disulfide isomerase-like protein with CxxC motif